MHAMYHSTQRDEAKNIDIPMNLKVPKSFEFGMHKDVRKTFFKDVLKDGDLGTLSLEINPQSFIYNEGNDVNETITEYVDNFIECTLKFKKVLSI